MISQKKAAEGRELTTGAPLAITGERNKYAGMKFVPQNTSLYQFSFDTSIYEVKLFSASEDGEKSVQIDGDGSYYRPDEKLQAGKTYYLFVRTYADEDYTVSAEDLCAKINRDAESIADGQTVSLKWPDGNRDSHYFRFMAGDSNAAYTFYSEGDSSVYTILYDQDMNTMSPEKLKSGENFQIKADFKAGVTYTLEVHPGWYNSDEGEHSTSVTLSKVHETATVDLTDNRTSTEFIDDIDDISARTILSGVAATVGFTGTDETQTITDLSQGLVTKYGDKYEWYAIKGFDGNGKPLDPVSLYQMDQGGWFLAPAVREWNSEKGDYEYSFLPKAGHVGETPSADSVATVPVTIVPGKEAAAKNRVEEGDENTKTFEGSSLKYSAFSFVPKKTGKYDFVFDGFVSSIILYQVSDSESEQDISENYDPAIYSSNLEEGRTYDLYVKLDKNGESSITFYNELDHILAIATPVSLGGSIPSAEWKEDAGRDQTHYYSFTPSAAGKYEFYSEGIQNIEITLYDSDMNKLGRSDGTDTEESVRQDMEAGKTYVFKVSASYVNQDSATNLYLREAHDAAAITIENSNSNSTAPYVADLDQIYAGTILQNTTAVVSYDGDPETETFTYDQLQKGITTKYHQNIKWYVIGGFDENGKPESISRLNGGIPDGTWYVVPAVSRNDNYYSTDCDFLPKEAQSEGFVPSLDTVANFKVTVLSKSDAAKLHEFRDGKVSLDTIAERYTGAVYQAEKDGLYQFTVKGAAGRSTSLSLYEDTDGSRVSAWFTQYDDTTCCYEARLTGGSTYDVFVSTGDDSKVTVTAENLTEKIKSEAVSLTLDKMVPAEWTTDGENVHYYSFTLDPDGQSGRYLFYSDGNTYVYVDATLYDSDINQLASENGSYDYGRNFRLTYDLEAGKTYYLKAVTRGTVGRNTQSMIGVTRSYDLTYVKFENNEDSQPYIQDLEYPYFNDLTSGVTAEVGYGEDAPAEKISSLSSPFVTRYGARYYWYTFSGLDKDGQPENVEYGTGVSEVGTWYCAPATVTYDSSLRKQIYTFLPASAGANADTLDSIAKISYTVVPMDQAAGQNRFKGDSVTAGGKKGRYTGTTFTIQDSQNLLFDSDFMIDEAKLYRAGDTDAEKCDLTGRSYRFSHFSARLDAGTYYLFLRPDKSGEFTITKQPLKEIKSVSIVKAPSTITIGRSNVEDEQFEAKIEYEDGSYTILGEDDEDVYGNSVKILPSEDKDAYYTWQRTPGNYKIYAEVGDEIRSDTVDVQVLPAPSASITLDEVKTVPAGESAEFTFTPEETGYYRIIADGVNYDALGFESEDERSYGTRFQGGTTLLNGGKTYKISVPATLKKGQVFIAREYSTEVTESGISYTDTVNMDDHPGFLFTVPKDGRYTMECAAEKDNDDGTYVEVNSLNTEEADPYVSYKYGYGSGKTADLTMDLKSGIQYMILGNINSEGPGTRVTLKVSPAEKAAAAFTVKVADKVEYPSGFAEYLHPSASDFVTVDETYDGHTAQVKGGSTSKLSGVRYKVSYETANRLTVHGDGSKVSADVPYTMQLPTEAKVLKEDVENTEQGQILMGNSFYRLTPKYTAYYALKTKSNGESDYSVEVLDEIGERCYLNRKPLTAGKTYYIGVSKEKPLVSVYRVRNLKKLEIIKAPASVLPLPMAFQDWSGFKVRATYTDAENKNAESTREYILSNGYRSDNAAGGVREDFYGDDFRIGSAKISQKDGAARYVRVSVSLAGRTVSKDLPLKDISSLPAVTTSQAGKLAAVTSSQWFRFAPTEDGYYDSKVSMTSGRVSRWEAYAVNNSDYEKRNTRVFRKGQTYLIRVILDRAAAGTFGMEKDTTEYGLTDRKLSYEFVSGTEGAELPDAVRKLLPAASTEIRSKNVLPQEPAEKTIVVLASAVQKAGTWTFKGYTPALVWTYADQKVTGTWEFSEKPSHLVKFTYKDADPDTGKDQEDDLEAARTAAKLPDSEIHVEDEEFTLKEPAVKEIPTKHGHWTFKGYSESDLTMGTEDIPVDSLWTYSDDYYHVTFRYVSATAEATLPETIKAPEAVTIRKGEDNTAKVADPASPVEYKGGTWTFKGYKAVDSDGNEAAITDGKVTVDGKDITVTGSWEYTDASVEEINAAAAVNKEIEAVKALGEVTLEDEETINKAKADYEALSEKAKKLVNDYETLHNAELDLERLKHEAELKTQAQVVIDEIDQLIEVTLDSKDAVTKARSDYQNLPEAARIYVTNLDTLTKAEATIGKLEKAKADAEAVTETISSLGDVTLDSKSDVAAARAAYDSLSEEAKGFVSKDTVTKLTDAEDKIDHLEAKAAEEKIAALTDVSLENKSAVEDARAAYDALSDKAKALVPAEILQTLEDAEAKIAALEKEKKDKEDARAVTDAVSALGEVTLDIKDKVTEARKAYNALSQEAKALVPEDTLTALTDAETKVAQLEKEQKDQADAAAVAAAIAKLGSVSLADKTAVEDARKAYDALSEDAKQYVTNLSTLTGAEDTVRKLQEAKEAEEKARNASDPKLPAASAPLKNRQKSPVIPVTGIAPGDRIVQVTSSNTKLVKPSIVGNGIRLKGGRKKKGKAVITVILASGKTTSMTIRMQGKKVTTRKIKVTCGKRLVLQKGEKVTIGASLTPCTSPQKITYKSSRKRVAAVNRKGVITARKKGKAVITVKSGNRTVKIRVTVK